MPIITDGQASALISLFAPSIGPTPPAIDGAACLWGLFNCERYIADDPGPRFEPSYAPGGYYYDHSPDVRERWAQYDHDSACSYSNWQILFNTACELDYEGAPQDLDEDDIALPFVVQYIKRWALNAGAIQPEQIARAYNGGNIHAQTEAGYVEKFMAAYEGYSVGLRVDVSAHDKIFHGSSNPSSTPPFLGVLGRSLPGKKNSGPGSTFS